MGLILAILLALLMLLGALALLGGLALLLVGFLIDSAGARDPQFKEPRHDC